MNNVRTPDAPVNGGATTTPKKFSIKPHWKLRWLTRLTRLKNAGEFPPAALDMALAIAECLYEKPLAEVSCSFLAQKTGLRKRSAVRGVGALERAPDTVIVRVRGQWQGKVKSKYAIVLTPEDLGPADAAALGVTGPVASDELWVTKESPIRVTKESPTRVTKESPNNTNSAKHREAELVSADAGRPRGGLPRSGGAPGGVVPEVAVPDAIASDAVRRKLFEAFWAEYPRKEGRAAAKKEFDAAVARDVPFETIMDGARRYAVAKVNVDDQWRKMPGTWLREECWTEDPKPPRPKVSKAERASKASKGNGKADPQRVADLDLDDEDYEDETPEQAAAREAGFPIGATVWDRRDGKPCMVTGVTVYEDGSFHVRSGGVGLSPDQLALADPFTPEQRAEMAKRAAEAEAKWKAGAAEREAKSAAEREARWKAEREAERRAEALRKTLERFPIGSRIASPDDGDFCGVVTQVESSDEVWVDWDEGWPQRLSPDQLVRLDAAPRAQNGGRP
jgi:hypothetical protein